jgi:hypothetical protein
MNGVESVEGVEGQARITTAALPLLSLLSLLSFLSFIPEARAQVADSAAVVADTLALPADSLAAPGDALAAPVDTVAVRRNAPVVGFAEPEPGRTVSAVPTRRPVYNAATLLGDLPGAFHYDLGVTGWADGVSRWGLAPRRAALTLDGVPASDLFTGRPAWELLPLDAVAPLRVGWGAGAVPVETNLRAYAASVPVTELRFRTGIGRQFISATHAQTRRPGWVRRLGGDRARLQGLFHVSGREADRDFRGFNVSGWQLAARLGLALPAFSLEITERHGRDRAGAPAGLAPAAGLGFDTVFDPDLATVLDAGAERVTIRNDLAARLRLGLFGEPLTATVYWTAETFRYANAALDADTVAVRGDRVGLRVGQAVRWGGHRLWLRAEAWTDASDSDTLFAGDGGGTTFHLGALDSLAVAGWEIGATAGVHVTPSSTFPTLGLRVERRGAVAGGFADVRTTGVLYGRVERAGFGPLVRAQALGDERTLRATAGADAALGPFDLGAEATFVQQTDPRLLLADAPTAETPATFVTAPGTFRRATGTLRLGWRDRAARGVYLRLRADAQASLDASDSDLHEREADAVPPLWGTARLGFRALDLFEGALDLDLAVRGRGWTAFRGRIFHAPTGLFALPPRSARPVDAGGTLDVFAEAGIGGGRATVFVVYENALADRAYPGAYVVPVYPLPSGLRFGVFWLLPY